MSCDPCPGLHLPSQPRGQRRVGLGHLLGTELDDAPLDRRFDSIPLAGGPGREDHVGPVAILDHVANHRSLALLGEGSALVQYRYYGY